VIVRVLVAADRAAAGRRLERLLQERETLVSTAPRKDLWERLTRQEFDLIVAGRSVLPHPPGSLINEIRKLPNRPEIIVVVEHEGAQETAALLAAGCLAVIDEETDDGALRQSLLALVQRCREELSARLRADRLETRFRLDDFVSTSPVMQRFITTARKVVEADSSLLLLGETGVGKERLARAIHAEGPRREGPFVPVNCGALPESLLESELFGHEEGAFTGASRARRGYFELAHRGTIFLDEIGELPLHLQVKLLRVLEDHKILRVGSEKPVDVDVRIIAATNRDLEAEVQAKRFRSDLFFRLAVVTLALPPLRDRREDIPTLVESYLEHFRSRMARPLNGLSSEAMQALVAHDWPGNVRELINLMEQMVLLCPGPRIELVDLPRRVHLPAAVADPLPARETAQPFDKPLEAAREEVVNAFERAYLTNLLTSTHGSINETARLAGITTRHLHDLMKQHGLRKEQFRR